LDPTWDENFLFTTFDVNDKLEIKCLDKDLLKDDKIGDLTIQLNSLTQGQETVQNYKLEHVSKGEIQLGLKLDVDNSPEVQNVDLISLSVELKSAKNLIKLGKDKKELPSAYAVMYFGNKCHKTNHQEDSTDPIWKGQEYRWTIKDANEKIILPVCVYSKKSSKKDEFLGLALIPLAGVDNDGKTSFYTLHGVDSGEIEIAISTNRPNTSIPISDPTISQNELERKIKYSTQFIRMSKDSQAGGLKKFGSGFTSFLSVGVQFLVDNSDEIESLLSSGGDGGG